ncbi:hypothetical protein PybrP1_008167 [[Pythium] brassicae (nom. inval.)]|nr:hypothetical protein PybrP1_008167 [[Pythium] brassicae (nom. inval.)]
MLARLRAVAAAGRSVGRRHIGGFAAPADAAPTVAEKVVNVVLVDYEGNRHFIQGRQGQTLRQACEMNNVGLSHVVVSNEWVHKLPAPNDQELHVLEQYVPEEDRSANSRLGTEIVLSKDLDGLVVAVPEAPPVETYVYDHDYEDDGDDDDDDE